MAEVNTSVSSKEQTKSESSSDEELTFDSSAYELYHAMQTGIPCLTFDIIPHPSHKGGIEYPLTLYLVAGSKDNTVMIAFNNNKLINFRDEK